jgi:proteasome accessory factor B
VVEFDYAAAWSNPGATRRARVRPYLIEPSAATLATYLIGFDEGRDAMRTFRLDRMSNAQVGITTFVRPRDMELEKQLSAAWDIVADQPLEEVVIKFSSSAAGRVAAVRWHPSQETEMQGDGSLLWRARLSGTHEVRPWILGWGGDAEVIAPVPLREDIARTHRDAATVYGA